MDKGTYVYCQTRFEGLHCWPNAPDDVKYLRYQHRHEFYVKVIVQVMHADRYVEFITLKKNVNEIIYQYKNGWEKSYSCEMMADEILQRLKLAFYDVHSVEVSEDGENGAIVVCQ